MSRRTKFIIWSIAGVLAAGIAWFAYGFCRAWYRFASEERLCGGFQPVVTAIERFHETTGALPANLVQLVPFCLPELPTPPLADSVDYLVMPGGSNWQLTVRSRITGKPRVFVRRFSGQFTEEELQDSVTAFHGWVAFKQQSR
jgi:hypothetical protein